MKRKIKLYKKFISFFLAVMTIYSIAFPGVTVWAVTTPTITATLNSTKTKSNVTISYSSYSSGTNQYRITIGGVVGEWKIYNDNFDVTQNCTIEAQRISSKGSVSAIARYIVNDIIDNTQSTEANNNSNGDWNSKNVNLNNTNEAQLMVRVGDIDNFGFGWKSVDPFSGNETVVHSYPFTPSSDDPEGTDKIMVVSGYNNKYTSIGTNTDGYTRSTTSYAKTVNPVVLNYSQYLSGVSVQNATIQMFLDDFQPGNARGVSQGTVQYKATINGVEIPELSNVINNLDESGPIGKLITFQIPQRYLDLIRTGSISLKFDDTNSCTGDGYSIDFVKLLINKTNSTTNTATITGNVKDANNQNIEGATVSAGGVVTATTDANGNYTLNNVPAGQAIVTASKTGYNTATQTIPTVISGGGYIANFTLTSATPPATPIISATPTTQTTGKVTASIVYSSDSSIKQYRVNIGGVTGEWKVYTGSFDVTQNCIIEAQGINQYGNASQIASYKVSNITTNTMPQVKIDVRDATGTLDEYSASSTDTRSRIDKDVTSSNYVLKGDSYADFNISSNSANAFQYSIIKNSGTQTNMPSSWDGTVDLQSQSVNQDVVTDKQGFLTQRAYDVNHMLTLTDTRNWSDPTQVFRYPYPEIGYKSADTSNTKDAYGYQENVVPYNIIDVNGQTITVNSRWHSNTVFMSNMDIFGAYKEASKFWGYIKVPQDGNYIFGAVSDDGCRAWITANGLTQQVVNMFQPQSATFGSSNTTLSLKAGQYYPIYLEYFNWGGSAAFQLYYTNSSSSLTNSNKVAITKDWFYPSKSTTPGEYAQTLFTGSNGIKLPDSPGQYYIAYRTVSKNTDGSINTNINGYREGIYGPFVVKPTAPLSLNKVYDNQNAYVGSSFEIKYTITPNDISVNDFSSTVQQNLQVSNIKFNELLPSGLTVDTSKIDTSKILIVTNGNSISGNLVQSIQYNKDSTGTKYTAQPITFSIWVKSDTKNTYSMLGQNSYIAYQDIDGGNRTANFNDLAIVVNMIIAAPVITDPITGTSTSNNRPTISGTGQAGLTVTVYDGTTAIGTAIVDSNGNWSLTPTTALSGGRHAITATQADAAGNTSGASNTVNLTIVPSAPVITSPTDGTSTSNNRPTISGTGQAGLTVTVYDGTTAIGTAIVDSNGNWSLTPTTALSGGRHAITATQADAAGNTSGASNTVNLTIVPSAPVITSPTDGTSTSNNRPTISGTGQAGYTVTVYDNGTQIGTATVDSNGNWSLTPTTALAGGRHAITATQADAAGNTSGASNTVNLTIVPSAPVITSPTDGTSTSNNRPTISGTGQAGYTVTVYDNGTQIGTATVDSNGNWSLTPTTALAGGRHAITATQADASGNTSGASNTVNLTIVPSAPAITDPITGTSTSNNRPTIIGTGQAGLTVTVYDGTTAIGTAPVDSNGNWSLTPATALANGNHAITATQADASGNTSGASNTVNLTIVPSAPIITDPITGTSTSNNRPAISGTGRAGYTVTVYDGITVIGTATVDSNGNWSLTPTTALTNGNHVITATQADASGNTSGASNTVNLTILLSAPAITDPITGTSTSNNRPAISGTGQAGLTVTVYDGTTAIGTATVDSNGNWSLTPATALANGNHAITATQADASGNTSGASNTVNLTIVPSAPIITDPITGTSTTNNRPTISGTGRAGYTVTVYDGITAIGTATVDSNGNWSLTPATALANGNHAITATQADASGNTSGTSNTVNITIVSAPSIISAHGLYNGNVNNIINNGSLDVTKEIPVTMGIIVDAKSSHPVIKLSMNNNTKITVDNASFKGYYISGGTIGSPTSLSIDGSGNITGLSIENGNRYLIVYTIMPRENGAITLTATADETSSVPVTLNVGDRPDLF